MFGCEVVINDAVREVTCVGCVVHTLYGFSCVGEGALVEVVSIVEDCCRLYPSSSCQGIKGMDVAEGFFLGFPVGS